LQALHVELPLSPCAKPMLQLPQVVACAQGRQREAIVGSKDEQPSIRKQGDWTDLGQGETAGLADVIVLRTRSASERARRAVKAHRDVQIGEVEILSCQANKV
jgi:hypothetical protein